MKLKHVPDVQEQVKHSFKIEEGYASTLDSYVEYVSGKVGKPINKEDVISSIVKTFLDDDKQFLAWLKQYNKTKVQKVDHEKDVQLIEQPTPPSQY